MKISTFIKSLMRIVAALSLMLCLYSCTSVSRIQYEVLVPADTTIDLNITEIDIVNKFWANYRQKEFVEPYKFSLDSLFSFESVKTIYHTLNQTPRFTIASADTLPQAEQSTNNPRIELQNTDINVKVITDPVKDYQTNYYYAAIQISYNFEWAIISENNQNIYSQSYNDTIWLEGSKRQFTNIADLVDFDRALYYITEQTAGDFAKSISPHWSQTYRYIFVSGHNDMIIAAHLAEGNKWNDAQMLWQRYIYSNNKNLAGKANYNMAIKNEKEGNLLEALHFVNVAIEKYHFKPAIEYAEILKNRIGNLTLIEQQLP